MDILTIRDLKKDFGAKQVLKGLSLCVPEQSVFGFVGRNGSGKTTTMKAVLGLLKPDAGEIFVAGERVLYGETPTNRFVGYLPDVPEFYSFMTAREYLRLCGESLGLEDAEIKKRSDELLSMVGLFNEKSRVKGYSRGMKQRLGIAQALFSRPKLLICDEPTSALDPIGRKEILDLLLSVREQTTVLFSTHILSDVERCCTGVAFLHDGRIVMEGTVDGLLSSQLADGFCVELASDAARDALISAFADARPIEGGALSFSGGEEKAFSVLGFIKDNRLPLRRFERTEASLETLFLEVMGK